MSRSKFCTRSNTTPSGSGVVQPFLNSLSPPTRMSKNASNTVAVKADENTPKRRINRCNKCDNCLKDNCGFCRNCKDMRKFGGSGTKKQSCLTRPKCLNVVIPTMEKHDKRNPVLKRSLRSAGRPRKFAKLKDKNENIIKVERTSKDEKDDFHEDIILPYEPRLFPMSDADYHNMMSEETGNDGTESFSDAGNDGTESFSDNYKKLNKYKDIPTRSWRISELRRRKRLDDSVVNDTEEIMYPVRDCRRKLKEVDDFEDTRDEVYMMRHAKAAANYEAKKSLNDAVGGWKGEPENDQDHNSSILVEESTSVMPHNFENTREVVRRLRHSRVPAQEETTRVKPLDDEGGGLQAEPEIDEASGGCKDMNKKEYRLRHHRTVLNGEGAQIGILDGKGEKMKEKPENEKNKGGIMVTRAKLMANTLSRAGISIAGSLLKDTTSSRRIFLIPMMSHHLEVKFPELSNFEDDPNLQAILHSSKIPKCMKDIQTGRKKLGPARGLRTRRTSGAQSKA